MFPVLDHKTAGEHQVTGTPVKLSGTPGRPSTPAPLLGEHTRSVLKELFQLEDPYLDELTSRGIIYEATSVGPSQRKS
jgi:crotonobetainyl-CoA:carnitine CoA-transferase CaiB-like acyl-CoA transferase